jgi:hypothetical protein
MAKRIKAKPFGKRAALALLAAPPAVAHIIAINPIQQPTQTFPAGTDVPLSVDCVVNVDPSAEQRINVTIVSSDAKSGDPVADAETALDVAAGTGIHVAVSTFHHHANLGTYNLKVLITASGGGPGVAIYSSPTPWTYQVV